MSSSPSRDLPFNPVIQILGMSRSGKSTLLSQLLSKGIKESRYEHTSEITKYCVQMKVPISSIHTDVLPGRYTVELYDTPGVSKVDIPKVKMK
jgi:hypothetical protein